MYNDCILPSCISQELTHMQSSYLMTIVSDINSDGFVKIWQDPEEIMIWKLTKYFFWFLASSKALVFYIGVKYMHDFYRNNPSTYCSFSLKILKDPAWNPVWGGKVHVYTYSGKPAQASLSRLKVRIAGWRAVNKLDLQFTAFVNQISHMKVLWRNTWTWKEPQTFVLKCRRPQSFLCHAVDKLDFRFSIISCQLTPMKTLV